MLIVSIATEWGSAQGGVNSFNFFFVRAISEFGQGAIRVLCVVTALNEGDLRDASTAGIDLIKVTADEKGRPSSRSHREIGKWLIDHDLNPSDVGVWVGHDTITGQTAVSASKAFGGRVALIHHMAYEEYQNLAGGAGVKAGKSFQLQQELFSAPDTILFGIGTYLAEKAKKPERQVCLRFDPWISRSLHTK